MYKESFRRYLEEAIGHENALIAFSAFEQKPSVSIRLNPFKKCTCPEGRDVEWSEEGRLLESRPVFTLDPLFHAGAYYVQDSSSMFVGHVFRHLLASVGKPSGRPLRVLDLCAAPGGKTTDLAASLRSFCGDSFILVANEVMKARVGILADNVALWGDQNVLVTTDDPSSFASLPGYFDIILADVPCSGEGMFRKDEGARQQWSEDNVALCEARQRRIIADVWPSLAPGGILIYSTCTFNRKENDSNVKWIAEELVASPLFEDDVFPEMPGVLKTDFGYSLVPGLVEGEGQYCSAVRKGDTQDIPAVSSARRRPSSTSETVPVPKDLHNLFSVPVTIRQRSGRLIALPSSILSDVSVLESMLHVVASGCATGIVKGRDFIPDADLALSYMLEEDAFPHADVDRNTALAYLHRDAVVLPGMEKGFILIRYDGVNLGFVKNLGNRCNNLHPQSRRIRMDINK